MRKNISQINTILFLNGDIPPYSRIKSFIKKKDFIICADGGANNLVKHPIVPDIIIGDLDSLSKKTEKYFQKKGTSIKKIDEQETTDFEKALMYIMENSMNNVIVFGAISKSRPDHTINNFSVMKRYTEKIEITLIDTDFEIRYMKKSELITGKKGMVISLMALPYAKNITTKNLKYPLKNGRLEFGKREGTLNVMTSNKAHITFESGNLLLFKKVK